MGIVPSHRRVRFASFEMDEIAGELRKDGVKIRLQEQPFQILQILLERPGEVVTRETFASESGLRTPSSILITALITQSNGYGRRSGTRPKLRDMWRPCLCRGYRFIGKTECEFPKISSLAVLPLEDLSRDPEREYFADGLTEALITILAKIGDLRVISRTSAMQYKGVHKPLREIARELDVDTVVEGTVLRVGPRVRITAQLIDAVKESHLWAESYERDLRDVLSLQSEIAQSIAREIQIELTPQETAQLSEARPVDPDAYEAYLRGRYYWNKRSGDSLSKGAECFRRAIERDPNYAAAYAGLGGLRQQRRLVRFPKPRRGLWEREADRAQGTGNRPQPGRGTHIPRLGTNSL